MHAGPTGDVTQAPVPPESSTARTCLDCETPSA
ncbi:MAG: hypothetical protein JWN79_1550 [Gemmatimonadetes bacterium]|nr:hypothetical protein [Gemmatimonadota bacterium]